LIQGRSSDFEEPFLRGLADLGYAEAQNIVIEWRADEGQNQWLLESAGQLRALDLDLVVATGENRARAMRDATDTTPIVLSGGVDPIGAGLIQSFSRPGGNVTGTIESHPQLHGKQLQLLREMAPGIVRVTVLSGAGVAAASSRFEELQVAAQSLGLELRVIRTSTAEALAEALAREDDDPSEAILTLHSGFISSQQQQIFDFANRRRLPAMYGNRRYPDAGGLAGYGPDLLGIHYSAAGYVDRILKGAHPADLSVRLPTAFDFIVNLTTARAIGITIPKAVLQQATEVIQ
jgi:putative tryptophan/tyrosine transport system substrate-binding protein